MSGLRRTTTAFALATILAGVLAGCSDADPDNADAATTVAVADDTTTAKAGETASPIDTASPTSATSTTPGSVITAASCAFEYSPATLAERAWAFDGALVETSTVNDSRLGSTPSATFTVNHWYRGGSGDQVTVQFELGSLNEFVPTGTPGTRLLVTGESRWDGAPLDDPVAWGCGFTQPWTPDAERMWRQAFTAT